MRRASGSSGIPVTRQTMAMMSTSPMTSHTETALPVHTAAMNVPATGSEQASKLARMGPASFTPWM